MCDSVIKKEYDKFFDVLKANKGYNIDLVKDAFEFACVSHGDQKRKSGEPYIIHPLSVAYILVTLGMDTQSIIAALLHDVVEDTPVTLDEIRKRNGDEIAMIIDGLTKLDKVEFSSREERQTENIRKTLIAMCKDIRIIIIKLADRLHNMRTLYALAPQKQRDIARETMEVYAPLAHRLGISFFKDQLEDLSLKYLDPVGYNEVATTLQKSLVENQDFLDKTKEKIRKEIEDKISNPTIEGRVKSIYGIYRKMFFQEKSFDEIFDVYAIRIIVNTIEECYSTLGIIHQVFMPVPNRFKDYITLSKPNGYQSLHTTVLSKEFNQVPFEVQIRTYDMHRTAEYGVAAHWKYKLGIAENDSDFEEKISFVRQLLKRQQEENGDLTDVISQIKSDIMPEETYALTPRGDVKVLPIGSTVIDFAYAIHSEVGNKMVGAKVNGSIVPITHKVNTGDIIEILTTKDPTRGPSRDWLNIVKTSEARTKIRSWYKRERREENIREGIAEISRELRRNSIRITDAQLLDVVDEIRKRLAYDSIDDFYAAIGYGGILISRIMPRIREECQKILAVNEPENHVPLKTAKKNKIGEGVTVNGLDNVLIKFSKCCNPLPGDSIIGFVTRGYGVSIHKCDCHNVPSDINAAEEPERWVSAVWEIDANRIHEFKTSIKIIASDRNGLLADITVQLANMHIDIQTLNSRETKDGRAIITATFVTKGREHMDAVIERIKRVKNVISVERASD